MKKYALLLVCSIQLLGNTLMATTKQAVITKEAPAPIGPFSQAIVTEGGIIYVSGQLSIDPATKEMITDPALATQQIMAYIAAILHEAGSDIEHIVKTTIYLTDMNTFSAVNAAYAACFSGTQPFPARETVAVAALPKGASFEISVVAVKK